MYHIIYLFRAMLNLMNLVLEGNLNLIYLNIVMSLMTMEFVSVYVVFFSDYALCTLNNLLINGCMSYSTPRHPSSCHTYML